MLVACAPGAAPSVPTQPTVQAAVTQVTGAASPAVATMIGAASPAAATVVAGASPAAATVVAGASPVAATVVATASPVAATAGAVVAPAATQVAGAASPAATQAAAASPAAATAAAASPVRISGVQVSSADSTIAVQNAGSAAVDLGGWRLRVAGATATLPANARVGPGESLTIHTGSGTSSGRDVYLGQEGASLVGALQPGATVALVDPQGATVAEAAVPR